MVSSNDEVVTIYTSKLKITGLLLISLGFVAIGAWLLYLSRFEIIGASFLLHLVSFSSIAFFGLCGLVFAIQLFNTRPSLVVDPIGIIDRSSAVSAGRVPWQDICEISITQVENQRCLTFYVIDPQKYIQRGNWLQQRAKNLNYKLYGSPIYISANTLKISLGELHSLVLNYHHRYAVNNLS